MDRREEKFHVNREISLLRQERSTCQKEISRITRIPLRTLVGPIERLDRNPRILDSSSPSDISNIRPRIPSHPRPTPQRVAPFVLDERSTRHRGAFHRGLFLLIISSSNDTRRDRKRVNEYPVLGSFNSFFDSPRAINRVRESLLELSGGDSSPTCQLRDDSVFLGTSDSKARGPIAIISPPLFKR